MPNDETTPSIQQFELPELNETNGYALFLNDLETDPLVCFHGTAKKNLESIIKDGFKRGQKLPSVSYAKNSVYSLTHVIQERGKWDEPDGVVFVVRFETLDMPGIRNNLQDIHVDDPNLQPTIIGYCLVPGTYEHK